MLELALQQEDRPFAPHSPHVFFYYDGPVLFQLPHPTRYFLASALPDEEGPWPFLVFEYASGQELALAGEGDSEQVTQPLARFIMRDYGAELLQPEPLGQEPNPLMGMGL